MGNMYISQSNALPKQVLTYIAFGKIIYGSLGLVYVQGK